MTKTQKQQNDIEDAQRILRSDYYDDVRSVAECLKRQIDSDEICDREHFLDVLNETIDGHRRVIITWNAMQGVIFSSQDTDLGIAEYGADAFDLSNGIPWSRLMYPIFERDVIEALETIGVNVNDPVPLKN